MQSCRSSAFATAARTPYATTMKGTGRNNHANTGRRGNKDRYSVDRKQPISAPNASHDDLCAGRGATAWWAFLKPRAPTGGISPDRKIIFVVEARHRRFQPRGSRRSPCPLLVASKLGPNMRRFGPKCDHVWTRMGDLGAARRLRCSKTGRRSASDDRIMVHEVVLFWGIVDFADQPNPDCNSGGRARDLAAIHRTALISIGFRCQVKYFMLQATSGDLNSI
jgi:hypothetical protein